MDVLGALLEAAPARSSNKAMKGDSDFGVKPYNEQAEKAKKKRVATDKSRKTARRQANARVAQGGTQNDKHPHAAQGPGGGRFVKKGDTGSAVGNVQDQLGQEHTGVYDANTASSVIAFQKRHGLVADGVVGRQTALALSGQYDRARKAGPGELGPDTRRLVGLAEPAKAKKSRKGKGGSGRSGGTHARGGFLVEEPLLENVTDALGNLHDLLGKFAPKLAAGKASAVGAAMHIPEYEPKGLKFGKSAGGSNGARIATHQDGTKWLVKAYRGNEDRVATELLSNAVYREMGAKVPRAGRIRLHNGKQAISYPLLEGKPRKYVFQKKGAQASPDVGQHFMTDALLGNWDVAGLEDDNILWNKAGEPFRVDQGGTLEFRAQGGRKDFGPVPVEVTTMMMPGGQGIRSSAVTGRQIIDQAAAISKTMTGERIDALVRAAQFKDAQMADRVRRMLHARVSWMGAFSRGEVGLPEIPKPKGMKLTEALLPFLQEAAIPHSWEEKLHPRDSHGQFIKKIGGLPGGKSIQLDSKTTIKKDKDGTFRVVRSGGITKGYKTPEDAARHALDASAKSKDADSLGGQQSHKDYNHYLASRGVDPNSATDFGGKKVGKAELASESQRLTAEIALTKVSDDKYVQRKLKTLEARYSEVKKKQAKLAADKNAPMSAASVGTAPPKPVPPPTFSAGDLSYDSMTTGKKFLLGDPGIEFEVTSKGNLGMNIKPTEGGKDTLVPPEAWESIVKTGTAKPVAGAPQIQTASDVASVGDVDVIGALDSKLPVGSKVKGPAGGAEWVKVSPGHFAIGQGLAVPYSKLHHGKWEVTHVPGPEGRAPKVTPKPGGLIKGSELAGMPVGTKFQVKFKDKEGYNATTFETVTDGKFKAEGSTVMDMHAQKIEKSWKVKVLGGAAEPSKAQKPIKGMQTTPTVTHNIGTYGTPTQKPPSGKNLDLAVGDVLQSKKGAWKYTVNTVHDDGAVSATGPNGKSKYFGSYGSIQFVQKADGSKVQLKDPAAVPATPVAPKPMTTQAIKGHLQAPPAGLTIAGLVDGDVISTPDGKVAILKPGEDAYQGYVTAYDVETGQKFEPPLNKPPTSYSSDPDVKKAAAAKLKDAQSGTKVTTSTGAGSGTVGGSSAVKVGPPAEFTGVAAWSAALPHVPKASQLQLTSEEQNAISGYTGSNYVSINEALRNSSAVKNLATIKKAALIKKAISKSVVKEDVWIGRKTSVADWKNAKAGDAIGDNGVLSTSFAEDTWAGDIHLNILVRKGSHALNVKAISHHSGENEILLPPGSHFHVLKRETKGSATVLYVEML